MIEEVQQLAAIFAEMKEGAIWAVAMHYGSSLVSNVLLFTFGMSVAWWVDARVRETIANERVDNDRRLLESQLSAEKWRHSIRNDDS